MLKSVSQSTPTNQYEHVGTGVQDSPFGSTTGNPFTAAMNNLSSVNTDMFQREPFNQNTDIFQSSTDIFTTPSSNWDTDVFRPPSPFGNTDIFQTASSNGNISALSSSPPTSPHVNLFPPLSYNVGGTDTAMKPSKPPFEIYQSPPSTQEVDIFKKPKPEVPQRPKTLKIHLRNATSFSQRTPSPLSSTSADQKASPASDISWQNVLQATPTGTSDEYQAALSARDDLFSSFLNNPHDLSSATSSSVTSDLFKTPSTSFAGQSTPFSQAHSSVQSSPTSGNPFYPLPNWRAVTGMAEAAEGTVSADRKLNLLLMTSEGTEHNVLQNTPSDVTNKAFSSSPFQETEASTSTPSEFSRPKPLPRVPPRAHPRTRVPINNVNQETASPVEEESSDVNIVFTGEERCVEDWPEDSPQLSSNWKPSGTLRLRRESIVEKENESNGGDKSGKKSLRKLALSISTRRRSKDKLLDDVKHGDSHMSHQRSELQSDTGSSIQEGPLIDVFSSDNGEQSQGEESKSAKKSKFKGSKVFRRKSKKLIVGQNTTENHSALELYEGPLEENTEIAQDETKVTPDFPSQKKKVLKKRLSNLNRHSIKKQGVLLNEVPASYPHKSAWPQEGRFQEEQNASVPKEIFMTHNSHSKDTELYTNLKDGSENKEHNYYGMDFNHGKDFSEEDHPKSDGLHHDEDEKKEAHGKKKVDHKKSLKIMVPHLTWKDYTNNNHPYGASSGSPSRDYYPQEGAKGLGYEAPEAMMSDYYPSATTKDRDMFPTVGEERPEFTSMGNAASLKGDYGAMSSPRYKEDYPHPSIIHKGSDLFTAVDKHGEHTNKKEDCKPKKPSKFTVKPRQKSKDNLFEEGTKRKSGPSESGYQPSPQFKSDPMEDEFFRGDADVFQEGRCGREDKWRTGDYEPEFLEDDFSEKCTVQEMEDEQNEKEPGKGRKKSRKISIQHLTQKDQRRKPQQYEYEDPPGATSSDYYMSDAAKADWTASQMDVRRTGAEEEDEEGLEVLPEEDEGDTDSLMEWWNTVEMWDEIPSDEESTLKEEETKSFTQTADRVHRGLRVFNKVFMEQAEVLYQHVLILHAIADDLSSFHRRAKVGSITGGTTMAVGGAAAIAGLALAPLTFGVSLVVSAVGLGVVTAGGITSASAALSDKLNDVQDRKKIELVANDYLTRLSEVGHCLGYVREGMRRLSCHPLLRRNNYYASSDWEVRRALQMVSLVREPADRAADVAGRGTAALSSLFKHMDRFFVDRGGKQELRKACKKEATGQVHSVATVLQEGLVELNSIREQMLDAYGNI
ncbi:uncharacterized protein si:cabz01007807.1 isoform X5 [Alosa sapidissima]|uniref:uncharacterized protein si:cabz01007807.1 isoform X5 n=1 Tax=Alosa sapidissima TaxID=34773 RepID=UPI001C09D8D0|nr:uncharacterized protein si:cabz01007807.1 isoform X5 [Alosa sapidissima]